MIVKCCQCRKNMSIEIEQRKKKKHLPASYKTDGEICCECMIKGLKISERG